MTIDKSLKIRRGMIRTRNVLTRAERIEKLRDTDRWQEGDSPTGLAKVRVRVDHGAACRNRDAVGFGDAASAQPRHVGAQTSRDGEARAGPEEWGPVV